jgi:hypothetical protein
MKEWWAHPNTVSRARMRADALDRFGMTRGIKPGCETYDGAPLHVSDLMPDDGLFYRRPTEAAAQEAAQKNAPTEAGAS